jgi:hypothetical protein
LTVIEPFCGSVIPVNAIAIARDRCGYCAVFKDRRRRTSAVSGGLVTQACLHPADAGLSKLNSMPATVVRAQETRLTAQGRPGSVDVLGPTVARATRDGSLAPPGRQYGAP